MRNGHGTPIWYELISRDPLVARRFYGAAVGLAALNVFPRAAFAPTLAAVTTVLLLAAAPSALAGSVSYAGSFVNDDDSFRLNLTLGVPETLVMQTLSYGGGVDSHGKPVVAGGFAPVLSLFDASGLLLQIVSPESPGALGGTIPVDPISGFAWDAVLSAALPVGKYTLVLTQDGNAPNGPTLADGFAMTGSHDYTGQNVLGQSGLRFMNADLTQRTGHWALELSPASVVPEPDAAALLAAGLLTLGALRRRQRSAR